MQTLPNEDMPMPAELAAEALAMQYAVVFLDKQLHRWTELPPILEVAQQIIADPEAFFEQFLALRIAKGVP